MYRLGLFPLGESDSEIAIAKFGMDSVPILAMPMHHYRSVETDLEIAMSLSPSLSGNEA